jgi:hypothetical protein
MANGWYTAGKQAIGAGSINLSADQVDILPVRTSGGGTGPYYTPDLAVDGNLTDIPDNSDCRPVAAQPLDSVTWAAAVIDSAAETFASFPAGEAVQGLVYIHNATGTLLFYQDTGTGLPFTPADVDVVVTPNVAGLAAL